MTCNQLLDETRKKLIFTLFEHTGVRQALSTTELAEVDLERRAMAHLKALTKSFRTACGTLDELSLGARNRESKLAKLVRRQNRSLLNMASLKLDFLGTR